MKHEKRSERKNKQKQNNQNYGSSCSIQEQNWTAGQNEASHFDGFERKIQVIWTPDNLKFAVDPMWPKGSRTHRKEQGDLRISGKSSTDKTHEIKSKIGIFLYFKGILK